MRRPRDWKNGVTRSDLSPDDPADQEDYAGKGLRFLIRSVHRGFSRLIEAEIGTDTPITFAQWSFLRVLWREDGISQRELSQRLDLMENTTVVGLNIMEKRGWITRERDVDDRRRVKVVLTKEGRALKRLLPRVRKINKLSVEGIAESDIDIMRETLEKILSKLETALADFSAGRSSSTAASPKLATAKRKAEAAAQVRRTARRVSAKV
jgi:DNA-binding MarR family transcriptional regulator